MLRVLDTDEHRMRLLWRIWIHTIRIHVLHTNSGLDKVQQALLSLRPHPRRQIRRTVTRPGLQGYTRPRYTATKVDGENALICVNKVSDSLHTVYKGGHAVLENATEIEIPKRRDVYTTPVFCKKYQAIINVFSGTRWFTNSKLHRRIFNACSVGQIFDY